MGEQQPVIYVVDDDLAVRLSLENLLESAGYTVQSFASADDYLARESIDAPSCLVLDVRLKGRSGLELQRELVRLGETQPVIFITGHGDVPMSVAAMKAGAIEFLTKPFRDQDLLDAVYTAIERHIRQRDEARDFELVLRRYNTLSPREREVMGLLASGLMNKQVATRLGLAPVTVKLHRAQLFQKLGVTTLADLVRIADRVKGVAPDT